jgi:hypothetical protein
MTRPRAALLAGVLALGMVSFGGGFAIGSAIGSDDRTGTVAEASDRTTEPAAPGKGSRSGDFWVSETATWALGPGLKVSVTGGGEGTSNCTSDETTETFVTTKAEETRKIGFVAKYGGSCFFQKSWSEFGFKVVDPAQGDKVIGTGRAIASLDAPLRLMCQPWIGPARFEWKGLTCARATDFGTNIRVTRAG